MSFKIVTDPLQIRLDDWHSFISSHPQGNIFQTPEFYFSFNKTDRDAAAITALLESSSNKIMGIIVALILKEGKSMFGYLSRRAVVMGAPLVKDNDISLMDLLISNFTSYIKQKAIFTQFRNMFDMGAYSKIFYANNYVFEEHLNIVVDLTISEDHLWENVHSKRRNEIRKAKKAGVIINEVIGQDNLDEVYYILKEVYSFAKLPLLRLESFKKIYSHLASYNMIRIYGAFLEDKMIGTMILLGYKNRIYNWYSGSYRAYHDKCPNDALHYNVFLLTKKEGYAFFDFGGAGKPGIPYGVRDYKLKFGGQVVNFGRFTIVHNSVLFEIGKLLLKIYKFLKS